MFGLSGLVLVKKERCEASCARRCGRTMQRPGEAASARRVARARFMLAQCKSVSSPRTKLPQGHRQG